MAHTSIQLAGDDRYYEGNSLDIRTQTRDKRTTDAVNLTGATLEFYLKHDRTDDDADALLEKTSTGDGADDQDVDGDIELTDGEAGEAVIHIKPGDTDGVLTDGGTRNDHGTFFWRYDVTDADGNLVTAMEGDWKIWAA